MAVKACLLIFKRSDLAILNLKTVQNRRFANYFEFGTVQIHRFANYFEVVSSISELMPFKDLQKYLLEAIVKELELRN